MDRQRCARPLALLLALAVAGGLACSSSAHHPRDGGDSGSADAPGSDAMRDARTDRGDAGCGPVGTVQIDPCRLRHDPGDEDQLSDRHPATTASVTVRLYGAAGEVKQAALHYWVAWQGTWRALEMAATTIGGEDRLAAALPPAARPVYYRFELSDGQQSLWLGDRGAAATAAAAGAFAYVPAGGGKTLRYFTDFAQPELRVREGTGHVTVPLSQTAPGLFAAGGLGSAGEPLEFYVRDADGGAEDRPPGGGEYYLAADLEEAWLERGTLFDVDPTTLTLAPIDAHTHPYGSGFTYDPAPMITQLPANGIIGALTMVSGSTTSQRAALVQLHAQQRWIVPLVWVNPSSHSVADVEALLRDHRFAGLKFHPSVHGFPADSAALDPFMQLAATYRVPVQFHSATDDNAKPARIIALAQRHPDVPVLMIHTELGQLDKTAVLAQIAPVPNIYAETSWTNSESILQAMSVLDSSRTIFGTDATVDGDEHFSKQSIADPQGQYVLTVPDVMAAVEAQAHPDAYANWAYLNTIRLYRWRFAPDPDLYDTDGDGQPDDDDTDDDDDRVPDGDDGAPLDPLKS